jgi:PAS domain S-box-containing protein
MTPHGRMTPNPTSGEGPEVDAGCLRALFDHSPEGILLATAAGAIQRANAAACRLLDRTEAEIRAGGRAALVDPEDPRVAPALAERDRTGAFSGEIRMRRRDGSLFPAALSAATFTDELGAKRAVILFQDLTAAKLMEAHNRQLAAIVASSDDAIIGRDLEGRILSWNAGAERLYGYTREEMIGRVHEEFIPESRREEFLAILARVRGGESVHEVETERLRKDGTLIHVSYDASPIHGEDGRLLGTAGIVRDIGPRKRAEEERERLIAELQAALAQVQTLRGLVPICAGCKKIRDDAGYWTQVEQYVQAHTLATFSHGLCPDCTKVYFPDYPRGRS